MGAEGHCTTCCFPPYTVRVTVRQRLVTHLRFWVSRHKDLREPVDILVTELQQLSNMKDVINPECDAVLSATDRRRSFFALLALQNLDSTRSAWKKQKNLEKGLKQMPTATITIRKVL
jgi:hypothetical protein